MSTDIATEQILVIPTQVFRDAGYFQGFQAEHAGYRDQLLDPAHTSYRARPEMEEDPSFKQLIPYVIFTYCDSAGVLHVFQYSRGKGGGEARLHAKRSIGIGGHISTLDAAESNAAVYEAGMRRALDEEVEHADVRNEKLVGLINDDETPVGRVHLGVVHLIELDKPSVRAREKELTDSGFRPVHDLLNELDQFETWSQIALKALFQ
jgi:predicted NUDIX family phosphoesterase